MKEIFVKKYWDEEDILFYLHFGDGDAMRQIEISKGIKKCYDVSDLTQAEFVYDQKLDELDLDEKDFITKYEFDAMWETQHLS